MQVFTGWHYYFVHHVRDNAIENFISSYRILSAKPIPCGLLFLIHATFNPLVSLSVFVYPFIPSFPECHISLPQNSIAFNLKWVGVPTRPWSVCLPRIVVAVQHPAFNILLHLRLAFCGFVQFPISRFFYICGDVVRPPPADSSLICCKKRKTHKKLHVFSDVHVVGTLIFGPAGLMCNIED